MKLATKLFLSIALIILGTVAIGGIGILQMGRLATSAETVTGKTLPAALAIGQLNYLFADFRIMELQHIYAPETLPKEEFDQRAKPLFANFAAHLKTYLAQDLDPRQQAIYKEFSEYNEQYNNAYAETQRLLGAGKLEEAQRLLGGKSAELYVKANAKLSELAAYEARLAREINEEDIRLFTSARLVILCALVAVVLLSLTLGGLLLRDVMQKLGKDPACLAQMARAIAGGRLDVPDDGKARGVYADLVGMAASLKRHIDTAREESARAQEESAKARQATNEAEAARKEAENARREGMLNAAEQLSQMVEAIGRATEHFSAQISQSGQSSAEQAARVSETAAAMDEMNATVLEVAKNAGTASDVSAKTRERAEAGAAVVGQAVHGIRRVQEQSIHLKNDMATLAEHARSINRIMGVISDIADQTNLLALNAAIEAARAGEAGRGFAVVADEVRKLAEKTMASTTDVGNAIKAIQDSAAKSVARLDEAVASIGNATDLANQSGEALKEIVTMVDGTADQVRAIAAASEQQSASSEEINRAITHMSALADQTAQAMSVASDAVTELADQTKSLTGLIEDMKRS